MFIYRCWDHDVKPEWSQIYFWYFYVSWCVKKRFYKERFRLLITAHLFMPPLLEKKTAIWLGSIKWWSQFFSQSIHENVFVRNYVWDGLIMLKIGAVLFWPALYELITYIFYPLASLIKCHMKMLSMYMRKKLLLIFKTSVVNTLKNLSKQKKYLKRQVTNSMAHD